MKLRIIFFILFVFIGKESFSQIIPPNLFNNNTTTNNSNSNNQPSKIQANRQESNQGERIQSIPTTFLEEQTTENNLEDQPISGSNNPPSSIFGIEQFRKTNLGFNENIRLATPESYIIGPQDELVVDVYGPFEQHLNLEVSKDGYIRINKVGNIFVSGLSLAEVQRKIIKALSTIYQGIILSDNSPLNKNQPSASIHLGEIRTIQVNVVGNVEKPGVFSVPSLARAINVLYLAGGPTELGTFRNIKIIRNNAVIKTVDLYSFLTKGYMLDDINLNDGDVIFVDVFNTRVKLLGEINKPLEYELKEGEDLKTVINNYAGGFTSNAYLEKIKVIRNTNIERKLIDVPLNLMDSFLPKNGDEITIGKIKLNRYENKVSIVGEIWRPGDYSLEDNQTILDLINNSGGFKENAFVNRILIQRLNPDLTLSNISINFKNIQKDPSKNLILQREDFITVYSKDNLHEPYTVTIHGDFNILENNSKYSENSNLINSEEKLRLGLDNNSQIVKPIEEELEKLPNDNQDKSIKQSEGERKDSNSIFVESEIPSDIKKYDNLNRLLNRQIKITLPFENQMTVEDLILKAGGLKESASQGEIEIVRRKKNNTIDISDSRGEIAQIIKFKINNNLELDQNSSSFILEPFDEIFIRNSPNYVLQRFVTLKGEINYPGVYGMNFKNERISDFIRRGGGLTSTAFVEGARLNRKFIETQSNLNQKNKSLENLSNNDNKLILEQNNIQKESLVTTEQIGIDLKKALEFPGSQYDLILQDGDIIEIPIEPQTVKISGQVLYPTNVSFQKGLNLTDYVNMAGGFTKTSARSKVFVQYPNGSINSTKRFLFFKSHPKITRGAEIVVPEKIIQENSFGNIAYLVSIFTGTITSIISVTTLIKTAQ